MILQETNMETMTPAACGKPADTAHPDAFGRAVDAACERACAAIAPAWPLDRAIAVNPHWGRIGMPVRRVAARMGVLGQIDVFPSRQRIAEAWQGGRITRSDLQSALRALPAAAPAGLDEAACIQALSEELQLPRLPLLLDLLDNDPHRPAGLSWRELVTHQISQTCASWFDQQQAEWQPERTDGLYQAWRASLRHDHGISTMMALPGLAQALDRLPASRAEAERWALRRLGVPDSAWADYLEAQLLCVNGWASYCAYLAWQARLEGRSDGHLRELLAIRLAWEAILADCVGASAASHALALLRPALGSVSLWLDDAESRLLADEVWQGALEAGYQRELAERLAQVPSPSESVDVEVQAAFCIDVRSEPARRAIEAIWPAVQTLGVAGFFGLPIAYRPLGTAARRPQLPGLLGPAMEASDTAAAPADLQAAGEARRRHFALTGRWDAASRWPGAGFSFVEAAGIGYLGSLARHLLPSRTARKRDDLEGLGRRGRLVCRPALEGVDTASRIRLAANVLTTLGITQFAPLVLLVGHGSQSHNNAHAAGLECGACCGQTGEVNARILASLLNDTVLRDGLRQRGFDVPEATRFVAALHNTTTDEFEAFELDLLPAEAHARFERLRAVLEQAGDQVRRERAARIGLDAREPAPALLRQLRRRANDGAQTRPEWGLANNAALLIAPRTRSRGAFLQGRVFMHDYDAERDLDGSVLELLMTAPMVVANWINWQYHASTCAPDRLGSGNKTLHNVVGGTIGVFEGNGGDLRIGLPRQSVHDGSRWIHEPLRLTVVVDAPEDRIERVLAAHENVANLVRNRWLHLWRFSEAGLARYAQGRWIPVAAG
jgi:uncharacterized protein